MEQRPQHKGQILKKLRESKGIALETVHESTKIPMDALKAIEEGYTIRTLSSFYYRGFLKIYAQFLKVDIGEILDDYHPEKIPETKIEKKSSFTVPAVNFSLTPQVKNFIIVVLSGILILLIVVKVFGFIAHKISSRSANSGVSQADAKKKGVSKSAKTSAAKEKAKATATLPSKQVAAPVSTVKSAAKSDSRQPISLAVRAKKDNWLQVKVDGQVVFRSTLRKGAVETWSAQDNVELSGKDIGDLEFELNGKIIGPVERDNRRAKKVVINQSGFSVVE